MAEPSANAENQWASIRIHNRIKKDDISVKNANLSWGKFFKGPKSHEISASEVDKIVVAPGTVESVDSCGRQGAAAGTEGTIDLYDGDTRICTLYWNSPWGSNTNQFEVRNYDAETSDFSVSVATWNTGPGALGDVDVTVSKQG